MLSISELWIEFKQDLANSITVKIVPFEIMANGAKSGGKKGEILQINVFTEFYILIISIFDLSYSSCYLTNQKCHSSRILIF